ncbi:MAG: hypothetical protein Q9208_006188 [Pyrenodesmia sp. 3 TL-2023]
MSDDRLGREAHNETSNLSLGKTTEVQQHSNITQSQVVSERDLEKTNNGFSNHTTPSLPHDASTRPPKAAGAQPEITYPEGGLQAWLVVLGSFSGMLASFGQMNTIGTFQAYLTTHQLANASPSAVGWIFSIYVFLAFGCGLQIGPIFDRKGPRWLVLAGSVCLVVGMIGVSESTKFWHFILAFSVLGGVGTSLIFTPAIGAIAHYFSRRRGIATGFAAVGGSVGGIIFPLTLQSLFPQIGFAWSVRLLALMFLILLVIANILIRTRLPPKVGGNVWPDFRIFGNVTFALTTAGVFFLEWGLFVPLSYISSYALANGVSLAFSYQLLAILNAGSVFGRCVPGYVADKMGRFNTMIATLLLCLVSVLGIWLNVGGNIAGLFRALRSHPRPCANTAIITEGAIPEEGILLVLTTAAAVMTVLAILAAAVGGCTAAKLRNDVNDLNTQLSTTHLALDQCISDSNSDRSITSDYPAFDTSTSLPHPTSNCTAMGSQYISAWTQASFAIHRETDYPDSDPLSVRMSKFA